MMRIPDGLQSLVDDGVVESVVRPLMSGKEAQVYLVVSEGEERVAKIYKDARTRSFQNRADYTEGRTTRNTRDKRAIDKRSKHGRAMDEEQWRTTEVDMIYRLHAAGVRVPKPFHFVDGVLIMDLVRDAHGEPAPRLAEVAFSPEVAKIAFMHLIGEVQRMLCAGVVHGDLSDFNVLVAGDGLVVIDFPQAVEAARNQSARMLLLRDVDNLHRFLANATQDFVRMPYAEELWHLYERGELAPGTVLSGKFRADPTRVKTDALVSLVRDAETDERKRRERNGAPAPKKAPEVYQGRPLSKHPTLAQKKGHGRPQQKPAPKPAPKPQPQQAHRPQAPRGAEQPRDRQPHPRGAEQPRAEHHTRDRRPHAHGDQQPNHHRKPHHPRPSDRK